MLRTVISSIIAFGVAVFASDRQTVWFQTHSFQISPSWSVRGNSQIVGTDFLFQLEDQQLKNSPAPYAQVGGTVENLDGHLGYSIFEEFGLFHYGDGFLPRDITASFGVRGSLPLPIGPDESKRVKGDLVVGWRWEPMLPNWKLNVGLARNGTHSWIDFGLKMDVPLPFGGKTKKYAVDTNHQVHSNGYFVHEYSNSIKANTHSDLVLAALGFPDLRSVDHEVRQNLVSNMVCSDGEKSGFLHWDDNYSGDLARQYRKMRSLMYLRHIRKAFLHLEVSEQIPDEASLDEQMASEARLLSGYRVIDSMHLGLDRIIADGKDSGSAFWMLSIAKNANVSDAFWGIMLEAHERSLAKMDKLLDRAGTWAFLLRSSSHQSLENAMLRATMFLVPVASRTALLERSDLVAGACARRESATASQRRFLDAWISLVATTDTSYSKYLSSADSGCLERVGPERSECYAAAQAAGLSDGLEDVPLNDSLVHLALAVSGDTSHLLSLSENDFRMPAEMHLALRDTNLNSPKDFFEKQSGKIFGVRDDTVCLSASCLCKGLDSMNRRLDRTLRPIDDCWARSTGILMRRKELLKDVSGISQNVIDSFFVGRYGEKRLAWNASGNVALKNSSEELVEIWHWVDASARDPSSSFEIHISGIKPCEYESIEKISFGEMDKWSKVYETSVTGHADWFHFVDNSKDNPHSESDVRCSDKSNCKLIKDSLSANVCLATRRCIALLSKVLKSDTNNVQASVCSRVPFEDRSWYRGATIRFMSKDRNRPLQIPAISECLIGRFQNDMRDRKE